MYVCLQEKLSCVIQRILTENAWRFTRVMCVCVRVCINAYKCICIVSRFSLVVVIRS